MKIKPRYIVAAVIMSASILLTPWAIWHSYHFRGHLAVGGEVLIIPMGLLLAYMVIYCAKEIDLLNVRLEQLKQSQIEMKEE